MLPTEGFASIIIVVSSIHLVLCRNILLQPLAPGADMIIFFKDGQTQQGLDNYRKLLEAK